MSNNILFLLVIIESYTICMTSADIMSTRDSHLNQNKYVLPTTLCHYALQNVLKWFLKEYFCTSAFFSIWVSSEILRKFHLVLTFLINVETKWKVLSNFCDLRIFELYHCTVKWMFHKNLLKKRNKNAFSELIWTNCG